MNVVIVESPAKAKTINKYLGPDFTVLASYGHVRDLPAKDGSVDPANDFAMSWNIDPKSTKRVNEIAQAVKAGSKLILATDPDREGEAISWHIYEILKAKGALKDKPVERVVFNAITKNSVLGAMDTPREIDTDLVDAYLARRALDYLVGFTLSPVLWRKLPGARSAGRVQSVSLRLICDRELEIEKFVAEEYWTIDAQMLTGDQAGFAAQLNAIDGKKLDKFAITDKTAADAVVAALKQSTFSVKSVESKPTRRNPPPPFTTSTLQQEASRKLGFSAQRTMQIAQRLYEGVDIGGETAGLITYMRTDGVQMDNDAIAATRNAIQQTYGEPYIPGSPRIYKTKAKNAQEAHEAIRPTDLKRSPKDIGARLTDEQFKLYDLIWKRTLASQMESASLQQTTADIEAKGTDDKAYVFRASGSVVTFDGFLKLYQEGRDDDGDDANKRLPALAKDDRIGVKSIDGNQHFTQPPPRYSEASLIKKMEELGIGRPSTYTAILTVLQDRGYVRTDKRRLIPEDKGRLVTAFLESFFERYVQYDFTANLEQLLDQISAGDVKWRQVLEDFWNSFSGAVDEIKDLRITHVLDALNELLGPHIFPAREDGTPPRQCTSCKTGELSLKVGKFGAFIGCSNYPECRFTRQLGVSEEQQAAATPAEGIVLGEHPETGQQITRHDGRFGPYVQLGVADNDEKPKRASIPKGTDPASLSLEQAVRLLSLPREVGAHPETGKPIVANFGRYGPFILHDGVYANLANPEEVFSIGINRAVTLLAEKQAKGGRRQSAALRELGEHPDGGPVQVMDGRYGPYVKHGKINATLPKDITPEAVTMEQALELIAARAAKSPAKKAAKKTAKKATKKPAKKAAGKPTKKAG